MMDVKNKSNCFRKEIGYLKSSSYQKSLDVLLSLLPDYFYSVPASSTGKYHPDFALGEKGLIRHTKVAVKIGRELLVNPIIGNSYTQEEKDLMLMGLVLHDGLKSGLVKSEYTKFDHPLLLSNWLKDNQKKTSLNDDEIIFLQKIIVSHMGPWNKDYDGQEVLPIPKTKYERFVHMCDYLASRKFLNVKFINDEIEGDL